MKKVLKAVGGLLLALVVLIAAWAAYLSATWDEDYSSIEKPALAASTDPEVIKRGEYVVHSMAHCSVCHAPLEVTLARRPGDHPAMPGGFKWDMGPMGTLYSRNITPDPETGIGQWTDPELARALKWGVGRDGKLLVFMSMSMPAMADEDLVAVISYLRTTAPVKQQNTPHEAGLGLKWFATRVGPDFRKPFLEKLKYVGPAEEPSLGRGDYLAHGPAGCFGCHTGFDMMEMKMSAQEFGGNAQPEPDHDNPEMEFVMPNLTPDPETGHIATWSEEKFVERFRSGRALRGSKMPWEAFREMTDADLRSVYRYLKSVPPVKNAIGAPYRKAGS